MIAVIPYYRIEFHTGINDIYTSLETHILRGYFYVYIIFSLHTNKEYSHSNSTHYYRLIRIFAVNSCYRIKFHIVHKQFNSENN